MPDVALFRKDARKLTFRPQDEGPVAIVRTPDEAVIDPATDQLYAQDRADHDCTFTPVGVYLAGKAGMFGMRLISENKAAGAFRPLASPAPDVPERVTGKRKAK